MPDVSESSDSAGRPQEATDPYRVHMRVATAIIVVALIGYGFRCVRKGWYEPPDESAQGEQKRKRKHRGTDFTAYYSAGELARKGENIFDYRKSSTPFRPYLYPPMFAVFPMAPLSLLGHNAALAVYYALNVVLLLVSLWLLKRLFWKQDLAPPCFWRRYEVGLFLSVLICGRFLDSNMVLGQANVVILFLLTVALYWVARERGFLCGLAVALATSIKVTPGLFGLYFLWSRRGWAMLGGAVGLAVFLLVAPATLLGFGNNWKLLSAYAEHAGGKVLGAREEASDQKEPASGDDSMAIGWRHRKWKDKKSKRGVGISLSGTFTKLFSPVICLDEKKGRTDRTVNILDLDPAQAKRIGQGLGLILLILTILLTAPRWAREGAVSIALSWGMVALTMLLISPLTRKAHCVVLLMPVAALIALLQQNRLVGPSRKWAWAGLIILGGMGLLTSPDVIGDTLSEHLHARGAFTWTMLVFYPALAIALWSQRSGGDSVTRTEAEAAAE